MAPDCSCLLWLLGVGVRAIRALGVDPVILAAGLLLAVGGRAGSRWATIALVVLAGVVGLATFVAGPLEWLVG